MMYEVWKWTQEEIDQYNEDAGDENALKKICREISIMALLSMELL